MQVSIDLISHVTRLAFVTFSISAPILILFFWITGLWKKISQVFFGSFEAGETEKFSILAVCFSLIIGSYWMMRTIKDGIFISSVGLEYIPTAKILSPIVLAFLLFIYSKLVDSFKKYNLFWIVCIFYSIIFLTCALSWHFKATSPSHPIANLASEYILGWIYYLAAESFIGIISGALFWAFVASTTTTESAKRGYPLIYVGAQIGNFFGPGVNVALVPKIGTTNLIFLSSFIISLIPIIMFFYMKIVPAHLHSSDDSGHKKKKTPFFEGLLLIFKTPYLIGIGVVSVVYEIISTIIEFQFKFLAKSYFTVLGTFDKDLYNAFMGIFGMSTALVALLFVILGTGFFIRKIGVKKSLLVYPIMVAITVATLWIKPILGSFFVGMISIKAMGYALNNPVKELLYIPTSKDVKFKAKGFIDGFGSKGAKASGSVITNYFTKKISLLLNFGNLISFAIIGFWLTAAILLGKKYDKLLKDKEIIE